MCLMYWEGPLLHQVYGSQHLRDWEKFFKQHRYVIDHYNTSPQGDEDSIYVAVGTVGPVSICFDVTKQFQFYKHGVFSRYYRLLAGATRRNTRKEFGVVKCVFVRC